ncbi:MAG: adenosylcobinamide-GDP ribazoletransferase [Rikenellaceae bacterium]
MIKREINLIFNAFLYYSRIKVPKNITCNDETLSRSLRYFPLVGMVVGVIGALIYYCSSLGFSHNISVIMAIISMVLSTGALHEDGLADFCDGFGGGYTKEAILRIMKDSFIGAYGVISLILMFILKFSFLTQLPIGQFIPLLILAQGSSRFFSVLMVRLSTYSRKEKAKAQHSALGISNGGVILGFLIAFAPLFIYNWRLAIAYLIVVFPLFFIFKYYIEKQIGGYTGDILGAMQQFSELIFYGVALALLNIV